MANITKIRKENLCISCGVCAGNCPKHCITYENKDGMYLPVVSEACIDCNKCLKVCPSVHMPFAENLISHCLGDYKEILCAKSKDTELLKNATSGGVVTTLITHLLYTGAYDCAFSISGYDYHRLLTTERMDKNTDFSKSYGSRYLTVSQELAIQYMLTHREQKVIIVATSCCVTGILNTIQLHNLTRENYLLIGLFCDKTMHYKVVDYFDQHKANHGKKIDSFFFRSKIGGKWPGKVRMVYTDHSESTLNSSERKNLKEYFVPERCLYCLDKLNIGSDISVGDNYIPENTDDAGVSSVILRTMSGLSVWNQCAYLFQAQSDAADALIKSQLISLKYDNLAFGAIKGLYAADCTKEQKKKYAEIMRKRKIGIHGNVYCMVSRDIKKKQLKERILRKLKKVWNID